MLGRIALTIPVAALCAGVAVPAHAEDTHSTGVDIYDSDPNSSDLYVVGNASFGSSVCIGYDCVDEESTVDGRLKVKDIYPWVDFYDTSTSSAPDRDWRLRVNDPASPGIERFSIQDLTAGTIPFTVEGGAPNNALWIETASGDVGLGTSMPLQQLHILDATQPTIRMEASGGNGLQSFDLFVNPVWFGLTDVTANRFALGIMVGAPAYSLMVRADGDVGLGTIEPEGKLHTKGNGVQLAYFESGDGGPVQVRFRTDSENRRFLAVDNDNNVKSQIIFRNNDIRFTGSTDSGPGLWMTVGPAGIVTRGPTCGSPCDATFDPTAFTPLPIEDHAAAMWANKFLGAIGPTGPEQPVNLSEKLGGVIHELEVAHIYIEELHARSNAQETAHAAQIAALLARVEALEATLQAK